MNKESQWPQYRDLVGSFSLDLLQQESKSYLNLVGLDSSQVYLLGIDFGTSSIQGVGSDLTLTVYFVEKSEYSGFDAVARDLAQGKHIQVNEASKTITHADFFSIVKRFGGRLFRTGLAEYAEFFQLPEDE